MRRRAPRSGFLTSLRLPLVAASLLGLAITAAPARAQLRIATYNVGASNPDQSGPRSGMATVLEALNDQAKPGFARDLDILLLQEGLSTSTTGQAYADLLNSITGRTTYRTSQFNGDTNGSGRPLAVYNSATVSLLDEDTVGRVTFSGQPRQTLRYQFRPVGYDASADFFVYNSHFKAVDDSSSADRRDLEAQANRTDAATLGSSASVIYAGDLNLYTASEPAFQTLTAPGTGQAFDPIDRVGNWSNSSSFKNTHTQSPATSMAYPDQVTGGMDDRFDFQLVSAPLLDGRGLDIIPDSYWAFGNTGTHSLNRAITTGSSTALQSLLPGSSSSQAGTVLTRLSQVADHLPVVADYQLPARMTASLGSLPAKVIAGAPVAATLSVANSAPVTAIAGADRLDYSYAGSGMFAGSGTGSDAALGGGQTHQLAVDTSQAGLRSGSVAAAATSPQTASPSFSQAASLSVVDHATASFSPTSTRTTLDLDFGILLQGSGEASRSFSIHNRPGDLGAAWTAGLDLDGISGGDPSGPFSTTLAPFLDLAAGASLSFDVSMQTATSGLFTETYLLDLSDEDLPGAAGQSLAINFLGLVLPPASVVLDVATGTETQADLGFTSITGSSSLTKTGGGTLLLDGINTFTGETSIEEGILALETADSLAGSTTVTVAEGASLDVSSLAGGYTVGSGQTITGSGTVLGSLVFGRGSTLSPGLGSVGSLALTTTGLDAAPVVVPEPGIAWLTAAGLGWLAFARCRPRLGPPWGSNFPGRGCFGRRKQPAPEPPAIVMAAFALTAGTVWSGYRRRKKAAATEAGPTEDAVS
ncbi:MAG: autotransporter-associated beta strand repeat-containing protein [Planctomycetota bacterium]|nr:autotransporter-associated beta strand repeat-containing protein [Planctomycetota bacterium]